MENAIWEEASNREKESDFARKYGLINEIVYDEASVVEYILRIKKNVALSEHRDRWIREAVGLIPKSLEGKNAIDVGCGEGRWARLLAERGADVIGIDKSPSVLKIAEERSSEFKNINFEAVLLEKASKQIKRKFDFAIAAYIFQSMSHLGKAFNMCSELLANEGELLVITQTFKFPNQKIKDCFEGLFIPVKNRQGTSLYIASREFDDYRSNALENNLIITNSYSEKIADEYIDEKIIELGIRAEHIVIKFKRAFDNNI